MLQIRLLGQFDIRLGGKRVTIPSRAGQSLLAYLALTAGTPHRREKLAGIFWPDTTDETARKYLRQELWRIRKAISTQQPIEEEYLLPDEFTLKFNREAKYWLDVTQMERPDLDLQSLIANLSLYQGELLPGFYDEWVTLERERIQAVFDARAEQLLEQLITTERWIAVQEWGERWLTLSGVREPAYRALMLASRARGDIAKVVALYQRCKDELLEQLGVEPSTETSALYDGLLKGAKAPPRPSAAQPSGTITFLFTDIEGSTRLLDKLGDQYAVALADHHEIMRAAIQKWNGREMDTQGDAFFVTFARALDAVQCAAEAQRNLTAHAWHPGESLRVRMGLHTGEPLIASTGYVGMDVHRAARIGDAGHGGQILLSQTTRELVIQDLPQGISIRDLGEYRLKDMKYPAPIYQLVVEGLPSDFAPIRTKFSGTEMPTPGEAPFKGLQFFDVNDSELFFGREALTEKLVGRLRDANFLSVIIGASGSGKSSLVRAGLVPLMKKGLAHWQIYIITPTAHPLEALAIELTRDSESVTAAATLVDDLSKDPRSLHFFLSRQVQTPDSPHTLLVIDQFEELFTLCRDEFEREAFIDNLLTALTPAPLPLGEERRGEGNVTLVITLRADFYAHLAQYPELRDAVAQQQEYIGPMTTEELRRAMEEPAKRGHWEIEPGLVDLILRDVGDEPGALPLLSHALLETWKRRAGHVLTLKGYAEAGGVHGAIAHTAESVYQKLSPAEQTIMRNILLRLTEFGEGTEDTRRRASFNELMSSAQDAGEVRAVLNKLAEARLVTLSEDTAEVAHEALIREWPQLREWLSQDRVGIILHRHLTEAAQEWELLERDQDVLYRGARLAQAREWAALHPTVLNTVEKAFLEASNASEKTEIAQRVAQQQRELEAAQKLAETEQRRAEAERQRAEEQTRSASQLRKRARYLLGAFIITLVMAFTALYFGDQARQNSITAQKNAVSAQQNADAANANAKQAESQEHIATSRELAAASIGNLDVDPERSILLALQAVKNADTLQAQDALHQAIQASRLLQSSYPHGALFASFSPDGTRLVTAGGGKTRVRDAITLKVLFTLPGDFTGEQWTDVNHWPTISASEAPNSSVITFWNATGEKISSVIIPAGIWSDTPEGSLGKDFSPDFTQVALGNQDGTVSIFDTKTGQQLYRIGEAGRPFPHFILFSPNGKLLLTGGYYTNEVTLWDIASGRALLNRQMDAATVALAFSPDQKLFAITDGGTVTIIDMASGKDGLRLPNSSGYSDYGLRFNADGSRLVTVELDGSAHIWDTVTGQSVLKLSGIQTDGPVAFSQDGMRLVTASIFGGIQLWGLSPVDSREWLTVSDARAVNTALSTDRNACTCGVSFSPDNIRVAVTNKDGTVKILDSISGKTLITLEADKNGTWSPVFSPDGTRIATANADNSVKIWDASTGKELLTLSGHTDWVNRIAFSPDGTRLATISYDRTARLWDATSGELLFSQEAYSVDLNNPTFGIDIAFSSDGTRFAAAGNTIVKVWETATGKESFSLQNQSVSVTAVAFSPDGTRLVAGYLSGMVVVYDATTGRKLSDLASETGSVTRIAYSPNGNYIAASLDNGITKLWDARTGTEQLTLTGHKGQVVDLAFSPDGTRLATVGTDETVRVYALRLEDLVKIAQSRVTRSLTTEECQQYLHFATCATEP